MKTLREHLIDILTSTSLYEMAENQRKCESIVESQCDNIIENLTLINYFRISGLHTTNINHWNDELYAALYNAGNFDVKKDHSVKRRERIVRRVFAEKDMLDYDRNFRRASHKFRKEAETQFPQNPRSREWLDEALIRTMSQMDTVMSIIYDPAGWDVDEWLETL